MNDKFVKLIGPLAVIAAGSAHAASTIPFGTTTSTPQHGSDLVLFVSDTTANEYLTFDTGISLDSVLSQATISAGGVQTTAIGTIALPTFSSAVNAALTNFLNTDTASGDNITWTIAAGDSNSINSGAKVGAYRYLVTGNTALDGTGSITRLTNSTLHAAVGTSSTAGLEGFFNEVNANIPTSANGISAAEGWGAGTLGKNQPTGNAQFGSVVTTITLNSGVASTGNLFLFASNSLTSSQAAQVYDSAGLTLNWTRGGSATLGGNAVPLPAAVWLFGSGLLGLFGIGRRKLAA